MKKYSLAVLLAGLCLVGGECFGKEVKYTKSIGKFWFRTDCQLNATKILEKVKTCNKRLANNFSHTVETDPCSKCCAGLNTKAVENCESRGTKQSESSICQALCFETSSK